MKLQIYDKSLSSEAKTIWSKFKDLGAKYHLLRVDRRIKAQEDRLESIENRLKEQKQKADKVGYELLCYDHEYKERIDLEARIRLATPGFHISDIPMFSMMAGLTVGVSFVPFVIGLMEHKPVPVFFPPAILLVEYALCSIEDIKGRIIKIRLSHLDKQIDKLKERRDASLGELSGMRWQRELEITYGKTKSAS